MKMVKKGDKPEPTKKQGSDKNTAITPELMTEWNKYLNFLDSKGVRGSADLDKHGKGLSYLDEYIKANPKTSLSRDAVPAIQEALKDYRKWTIETNEQRVSAGKPGIELNTPKGRIPLKGNEAIFMSQIDKTKIDGYPGQWTTQQIFPSEYMGAVASGRRVGFVPQLQGNATQTPSTQMVTNPPVQMTAKQSGRFSVKKSGK